MSLRCIFGHRWAVSTSVVHVKVLVLPSEGCYDQAVDGREERWVPWEYCMSCGMTRHLRTEQAS